MTKIILIGIAGGSASGKSTIANEIVNKSSDNKSIKVLKLDNYYLDRSHLTENERTKVNYDHPNAFDTNLLLDDLKKLKKGLQIDVPIYNFEHHIREKELKVFKPANVIILEGIMVLALKDILELLDIKIYVETPDDIRLIRRLRRDMKERSRTMDQVVDQYLSFVRPMHEQFVAPSKMNADIIIPEGGHNQVAISLIKSAINDYIKKKLNRFKEKIEG